MPGVQDTMESIKQQALGAGRDEASPAIGMEMHDPAGEGLCSSLYAVKTEERHGFFGNREGAAVLPQL